MSQTIAFIPVRGGSKSIPLKNIKPFCGKPLVYWTAKAAQESDYIDKIVIATDHEEIKRTVESFGFSKLEVFSRSDEFAGDEASTESVMLEYLNSDQVVCGPDDFLVLIQATSPLTSREDLDKGMDLMEQPGIDSVLSGTRIKKFLWNDDGTPMNYDYRKRPRRQDFEGQFLENGAFYINKVENILREKNRLSGNIGLAEMPEYTSVELDEKEDWIIGEQLMKRYINSPSLEFPDIKVVLTDVDGVLTDAGMYYSEAGDELKKFNTRDGKGLEMLRKQGFKIGIITSEDTQIVERRARKLKVDYLYQGIKDKIGVGKEIAKKAGVSLDEVAYIGDDVNDISLLREVGFAACPSDAAEEVKKMKNIRILNKKGGSGVVRELSELLLNYTDKSPL